MHEKVSISGTGQRVGVYRSYLKLEFKNALSKGLRERERGGEQMNGGE